MSKKQEIINKLLEAQKKGVKISSEFITKCNLLPEEAFETGKLEKSEDIKKAPKEGYQKHLTSSPYKDTHKLHDHMEIGLPAAEELTDSAHDIVNDMHSFHGTEGSAVKMAQKLLDERDKK